jgi:hypothetical protein
VALTATCRWGPALSRRVCADSGWRLPQRGTNFRQDAVKRARHRRVRDAQHAQSRRGEDRIAFGIALPLPVVDFPIDLDNQPALQTAEGDHEAANWVLAAERAAVQAPLAQRVPPQILSRCFAATSLARHGDVAPLVTIAHAPSLADQGGPRCQLSTTSAHPLPAHWEKGWG